MKVVNLQCENFRNLNYQEFNPSENVNIIYGDNAQGKTNILESIWLFTGGRSFRGCADKELVNLKSNSKNCKIEMNFHAQMRNQNAIINITSGKRTNILNQVELPFASDMVGNFCSVIFSPIHLSLIKEGPSLRRKFLDTGICQVKPSYIKALSCYNKAIYQRNTLIKNAKGNINLDVLDAWNSVVANYGSMIVKQRIEYIKKIQPIANEIYNGFSKGKESFSLKYLSASGINEEFLSQQNITAQMIHPYLLKALEQSTQKDIQMGYTTTGSNRDDLEILIGGISARTYGSQGQQRSGVLALKIAEAIVLEDYIGERPIVLLDDVMSELDSTRQDYILNQMKNWQVFITCCDPSSVLRVKEGKTFKIENGNIV